jgi:MFS family permease
MTKLRNPVRTTLRRHKGFWRTVKNDELARIYVSWAIRSLALSLYGSFGVIFLLQLGYDFMQVAIFLLCYFLPRMLGAEYLFGKLTAKLGAHKTMNLGFIFRAVTLAMFATQGNMHWPLWLLGAIDGTSVGLVYMPFHYAFATFHKHKLGGSELSHLRIIEKVGGVVGPLVGGMIATLFGGELIFSIGFVMMAIAGLPLLLSREVKSKKQDLTLKSLKLPGVKRDLISLTGLGLNASASIFQWSMYLGLFVLTTSFAYFDLGLLHSLGIVASIVAAWLIGRFTDKKSGRKLLRLGAIFSAILNACRPFIIHYTAALGLNVAHELSSTAAGLPYDKGYYDAADERGKHRLAYLVLTCWFDSIVKGAIWVFIIVVALITKDPKVAMAAGFAVAALGTLLITRERFSALN